MTSRFSRLRTPADPFALQIAEDPRVERRIRADVERGLRLGGLSWYGTDPIRQSIEEIGGPLTFHDFNAAGAAGSAKTSTHNELNNASISMFAKANGISAEDAKNEFLRRFPQSIRPSYMANGNHATGFFKAAETPGAYLPSSRTTGAMKIPNYYHNRALGAAGVPIDAHEQHMMAQALGVPREQVADAVLSNAKSYEAAMAPYQRVAADLGLHPDQVQAARWLGGGLLTGLKSQPAGDFLQTVEDGLAYTAQARGLDSSPAGLRRLWSDIAQGKDFFLPTSNPGGFPVY